MNDFNDAPDDEEVMLAFSVEPDHGPKTLQRYIEEYPHLASEFLDLVVDLRLSTEPASVTTQDLVSPEIRAAWESFNTRIAAGHRLTAEQTGRVEASLVSMPMREIGLPVSVLSAIKSGLVKVEEFPNRWLARIAGAGGYAAETLRSYLERPAVLSSSTSFKSRGKPAIGEKVTFRQLIESSTLSEVEKAEILRED